MIAMYLRWQNVPLHNKAQALLVPLEIIHPDTGDITLAYILEATETFSDEDPIYGRTLSALLVDATNGQIYSLIMHCNIPYKGYQPQWDILLSTAEIVDITEDYIDVEGNRIADTYTTAHV